MSSVLVYSGSQWQMSASSEPSPKVGPYDSFPTSGLWGNSQWLRITMLVLTCMIALHKDRQISKLVKHLSVFSAVAYHNILGQVEAVADFTEQVVYVLVHSLRCFTLDGRNVAGSQLQQRLSIHSQLRPALHLYRSKRAIKLQTWLVPVQAAPLQPSSILQQVLSRQRLYQQLSVSSLSVLWSHEQVFEVDALLAVPSAVVVEVQRHTSYRSRDVV